MTPEILAQFKLPYMMTLTVDPKRFDSEHAALDYVTEHHFIARLLARYLHVKSWVWVLEFHKSGWPHWHVVIDLSGRGPIKPHDLRKFWSIWRDKWGIGGLDISKPGKFSSPDHAMMYITKYLTKTPEVPYPGWFLKGVRRRMFAASRSVGALINPRAMSPDDEIGTKQKKKKRRKKARTVIDLISECKAKSIVLQETIDNRTGEITTKYFTNLKISKQDLITLYGSSEFDGIGEKYGSMCYHRLEKNLEKYKDIMIEKYLDDCDFLAMGDMKEKINVEINSLRNLSDEFKINRIDPDRPGCEVFLGLSDITKLKRYIENSGYGAIRDKLTVKRREMLLNAHDEYMASKGAVA